MAGEATARGWPLIPNTHLVRDLPVDYAATMDKIAQDSAGESPIITAATGITIASGWGSLSVFGTKFGRLAMLTVSATKTTANLGAATATGNITDNLIFTLLPTSLWAPDASWNVAVPFLWGGVSYGGHGQLVTSSGQCVLTDQYPTSQVVVGDVVRCQLMYRLAA